MRPESYRGIGGAFFNERSLIGRLAEIELPCLVLVGEGDWEFLAGADLLAERLPHRRRVTIPGSGHHPHQENEAAWLDAIEAFTRHEMDMEPI